MAALENLTKSADIATSARIINFVSAFDADWAGLRALYGITRPIRKAPGTQLKSKVATVTLADGAVAEGDLIPLSHATVIEKPYEEIAIEKYDKSVSIEAISEHGYDDAILRTDREFRKKLIAKVQNKFYDYLKTGSLTSTKSNFQAAVAEAEGLVRNKWDEMDMGLTEIVGFANIMTAYDYLGAAQITTQNAFGMTYIENFMGMRRLFLSSKIPANKILATPTDNLNLYYVDPSDSDFARAGLRYMTMSDVVEPGTEGVNNLIGFWTQGDYDRAASNCYALMGMTMFAEYLDGISNVTISNG